MARLMALSLLLVFLTGCSTTNKVSAKGDNGGFGGSVSTSIKF